MTAAATQTGGRILVIDDELGPRESLRILLKNEYEVMCADNVVDGLRLLTEKTPNTVIMDIRMPGKSGIDGLREIRRIDPHVSVIMLTGYAALETAQEALRLGANDYLKKPFDTTEMRRVVQANVQRSAIERRRAQASRELQDLNSRLADQLASKEHLATLGQASAEFAHDLRNPLSIVQGYIDLLARQIEGSRARLGDQFGETQDYLDIIEKNVRRCHELVETWQRLGKKDPKQMKNVCLPDLLRDVVKGSEPMAAEIGAGVQFGGGGEGCCVYAEPIQVYRAVQNIVKNAIQALPGRGGMVTVSCRRREGDVEIEVRDNGCGISPEQASRLFEPYYTTKAPGKGMGLGLFITKKIVEDYQGTINVESKVGGGTSVTIRLPAAAVNATAETAA